MAVAVVVGVSVSIFWVMRVDVTGVVRLDGRPDALGVLEESMGEVCHAAGAVVAVVVVEGAGGVEDRTFSGNGGVDGGVGAGVGEAAGAAHGLVRGWDLETGEVRRGCWWE